VDHAQAVAYARELMFPHGMLTFTGEQTPHEVAQWMQQSDCFVLFSNYENAPVVLSECLATGLPIISSRAGGIPEMVTDTDGQLVNTQNERQLTNAMLWMMDYLSDYPPQPIREHGRKYSYAAVGKQLVDLYQKVMA
jgi:glycosyltransferase involved in cell wall biosynthesis